MRTTCTRSDTVDMEAAFSLFQHSHFIIPDVGSDNVNQLRAFLRNSAWLQEYMHAVWNGEFPQSMDAGKQQEFADFFLVIVWPCCTGKTAVFKIMERLVLYSAPPDIVRKFSPSTAAARLFGADTLPSLCNLLVGGALLTSKKGRMINSTQHLYRRT